MSGFASLESTDSARGGCSVENMQVKKMVQITLLEKTQLNSSSGLRMGSIFS